MLGFCNETKPDSNLQFEEKVIIGKKNTFHLNIHRHGTFAERKNIGNLRLVQLHCRTFIKIKARDSSELMENFSLSDNEKCAATYLLCSKRHLWVGSYMTT